VRQSQWVFRRAIEAMASPGRVAALRSGLSPPAPLNGPAAALLLTLCDYETPVWLDTPLAENAVISTFLRFHTGASLVSSPVDAAFAAVADPTAMPHLSQFSQGTAAYPDRSTTLIVQVHAFAAEGWWLEGPGIRDAVRFSAAPLPVDFVDQLRANRATFPCGVDILFATHDAIVALPRSVFLKEPV
jgi:alpha-D-ribose 1-methylphosphonate 5-triphosphate synthase subunit PhnH